LRQNLIGFVLGLLMGAFTLSASAQVLDLSPFLSELKALRDAISAHSLKVEALSAQVAQLSVDGEVGKPAPKTGPVLMLVGPDGTVIPAQADRTGRLKVVLP
jgi:hypothetical protein